MKKISLIICCSLIAGAMQAQLKVTSGATITIQGNAIVFCQGDVTNDAGGTITNNGRLEVQGSFANAGTYNTTTADDSLVLSGGGNVLLNGGSSVLTNLWINKAAAGNEVKLSGTTLLSGKLDYDEGNFTTDPIVNPAFLFSAPTSATFDFAAGKEITGSVRRTGWTGAMSIFNQPNMQVTTAGGTQPTDFTVTMIPETAGGDPTGAEREVKRKFQFAQTGGTGFTTDIRYPYLDTELDLTNSETTLVPWQNITSVWNGRLTPVTRDGVNNYVSTTGLTTTDIANEWKLADPRYTFNMTANLRGPWDGVSSMNTTLNTTALLPLSQPYNDASFGPYTGTESVGAIPANVVDWVLLDLRMPASGLPVDATSATAVARKAGFVLNNGTVVDLDGVTPLTMDINKQGSGFFVLRHRNHLAVMSNSLPSNATGTYTNDFSVLANAYNNISITSPPMQLMPGSAEYGLWGGNANKDAGVNTGDIFVIRISANSSPPPSYLFTDVNLDGAVNSGDFLVTRISANAGVVSHSSRMMPPPKTHVPN